MGPGPSKITPQRNSMSGDKKKTMSHFFYLQFRRLKENIKVEAMMRERIETVKSDHMLQLPACFYFWLCC